MDEEEFAALLRYQNMLSRQVINEMKTGGKIKLLEVINDLTSGGKKKTQTAAILAEAEHRGMADQEIYTVFDELIKERFIEEKEGTVRKIH